MPRDHKKAEKTPLIKSSVGANRKTGQKWPKGRKEEIKSPFESQRKETKGTAWSTACHNYWSGGNGETSDKMAFTMHPLTRKRGGGVDTNNSSSPRPTAETDRCDLLGTRRDTGNAGATECKSEGEQQETKEPEENNFRDDSELKQLTGGDSKWQSLMAASRTRDELIADTKGGVTGKTCDGVVRLMLNQVHGNPVVMEKLEDLSIMMRTSVQQLKQCERNSEASEEQINEQKMHRLEANLPGIRKMAREIDGHCEDLLPLELGEYELTSASSGELHLREQDQVLRTILAMIRYSSEAESNGNASDQSEEMIQETHELGTASHSLGRSLKGAMDAALKQTGENNFTSVSIGGERKDRVSMEVTQASLCVACNHGRSGSNACETQLKVKIQCPDGSSSITVLRPDTHCGACDKFLKEEEDANRKGIQAFKRKDRYLRFLVGDFAKIGDLGNRSPSPEEELVQREGDGVVTTAKQAEEESHNNGAEEGGESNTWK